MRLFLAIDLPAPVRKAVAEVEERLRRDCPGWRWVRPEGIHLTLRFLGEVSPADDLTQREAWRRAVAAHPRFRFHVGSLGVFPAGTRPRILWLGLEETAPVRVLEPLAAALEHAARDLGFEPEERPFRAHLTLARAVRDARPVAPPPGSQAIATDVSAEEVVLFRSQLDPGGARYTRLESFPLGRAA
jgi:2'-5' RNA ligase